MSVQAGFPVPTRKYQISVDGQQTDFYLSAYADRLFFVVTQTGTLGTVLHAKPDVSYDGATTFNVGVLLGRRDQEELLICARRVVDGIVQQGCTKPVILSLALKAPSVNAIRQIVNSILENRIW